MKKKLYKYVFILDLVIIILIIFYISIIGKDRANGDLLVNAFNASEANIISSEVYCWGKIKRNNKDFKNLKDFAMKFAKELDINKSIHLNEEGNGLTKHIVLNGALETGKTIKLDIQVSSEKENEKIICVSVIEDLSCANVKKTINKLNYFFKRNNLKTNINICLIGNYDKKLGYNEINNISKNVFKSIHAKGVEGINSKNCLSVSAYSPYLGEKIDVQGKKVNMNLAIRHNSVEGKTYIWLATPLITREY